MTNRTINNILIYGTCAAVYLTLLVPLVVASSLYFPFVVGKAHTFRFLVEISFALYIILLLRDRSYLPKKSILLWSVAGFTAVLGLATIFAENPYSAFWSNFERMEGYVMILHLFAFFIVASSVLRGKAVWKWLLNTSLAISIVTGIYGFTDIAHGVGRIAGTMGNSTYLGVYSLLHIFIAGFLLAGGLKVKKFTETIWSSSAYILVILFNLAVLYQTGTRGSAVGLAAGVLLSALLLAILEKGVKRKIGIGILAATVLVVAFFGAFKDAGFIRNNNLLYRFSSLITLDVKSVLQNQGEARVLLWNMALRGVQERPILGWGQDNFVYVFAKYYDPKMYAQEQWFDRTHDVFLDWLISGGVLALLGYLSLFYALIYTLWRKPRSPAEPNNEWGVTEKAIFTGMLLAYFVHNIFVFDNLSSYIIFFLLIAYVAERNNDVDNYTHPDHQYAKPIVSNVYNQSMIAIVVAVLCASGIYFVVYKPYMAGKHLIYSMKNNLVGIDGQKLSPEVEAEYRLSEIKKALSYNTFGNTEIRERIIDVASGVFAGFSGTPTSQLPQVLGDFDNLVTTEYTAQFAATPKNPRPFIFYSMYLQKIGAYSKALEFAEKALELSPNKQSFLFQKGGVQFALGDVAGGLVTIKSAFDIEPENKDAKILYVMALIYAKKYDEAKALIGNDSAVTEDGRVLQTYLSANRYDDARDIIKAKIAADPANGQLHMALAGLYLKMHQPGNAIAEIQAAIKLAPQFEALGKFYIKEIQAGRDPSTGEAPTQEQLDAAMK